MSSQDWASLLAVCEEVGKEEGGWITAWEMTHSGDRGILEALMNNSLSCLLFHACSWGWQGDKALASSPGCMSGPSNTLFVVDLLTSNLRVWTMVRDHSWKFCRFKLSQDWEDISISSLRFFPIRCGVFFPLHSTLKKFHVKCKCSPYIYKHANVQMVG